MIPSDVCAHRRRKYQEFVQQSKDMDVWLQGGDDRTDDDNDDDDEPAEVIDGQSFAAWKTTKRRDKTIDETARIRSNKTAAENDRRIRKRTAEIDRLTNDRFDRILNGGSVRSSVDLKYNSDLYQSLRESAPSLSYRDCRTTIMLQDPKLADVWHNERHLIDLLDLWSTDSAYDSTRLLDRLVQLSYYAEPDWMVRTNKPAEKRTTTDINDYEPIRIPKGRRFESDAMDWMVSLAFDWTDAGRRLFISDMPYLYLTYRMDERYDGPTRFMLRSEAAFRSDAGWNNRYVFFDITGQLRAVYASRCAAVLDALRSAGIARDRLLYDIFLSIVPFVV